ncbi:CSP1 protein, partial [Acromyrmex heyeri]
RKHKISGNALSDQSIKTSLEKDICKCFIRELKPEIEQRITRNLGVQETVADALQIERELHSMTDLRQNQESTSSKALNTNKLICYKEGHSAANCRKLNNFGTEILICQICKKRGHSADKCRLRDPQARQSVNILQGNNTICQICSRSGHNAKNCRTNNNNSQNKPSITCQWCDKPGHSANNCWKKQNEQHNAVNKVRIVCQICNNLGHNAKNCQSKIGQNTALSDSLFCRYCKGQGHLLDTCELRIASNKDKRTGKLRRLLEIGCGIEVRTSFTPVDVKKGPVGKNALEIRPVMVNLDKHSRVPTVQVNFCESIPPVAFIVC